LTADLAAEVTRASAAEAANATAIAAEAVTARAAEAANAAAISAEVTRATAAEVANATAITTEAARATAAEGVLTADLAAEVTRATAAEATNAAAITAEASTRAAADTAAANALATEVSRATAAEQANAAAIVAEETARIAADSTEAAARAAADTALGARIDDVLSNIDPVALDSLTEIITAYNAADSSLTQAISDLASASATAMANEAATRLAADNALTAAVAAEVSRASAAEAVNATNISNEVSDRTAADTTLQSNINAEAARATAAEATLTAAVAAETTRATAAEVANAAAIAAETARATAAEAANAAADVIEAAARVAGDVAVQANVDAEATRATAAEVALGGRIDDLTTDDVAEGSLHQYFTEGRAKASISGGANIQYNSSTGVISTLAAVQSVNGQDGIVVLTTDNVSDATATNKYFTNTQARGAVSLVSDNNDILSYSSGTGEFTFATPTTDAIDEGANNLYYTNVRADARIAAASVFDLADVNSGTMDDGYTLVWSAGLQKFVPQNITTVVVTKNFTGDGTTASFNTEVEVSSIENTQVFINGLVQAPTYSYTLSTVDGETSIVFDAAPEANDFVMVRLTPTVTLSAGGILNQSSDIDGGTY
jgi:hypothetical protein